MKFVDDNRNRYEFIIEKKKIYKDRKLISTK
ncbi:hypothetical protein ABID34_001592 [Chryseobacterium limigenitum]